jgi:predicted enzyme related to lactoylglutathione lyase
MKLNGVMIGSEDSDKLGEFYTKVLGEPGWKQDGWYGFYDEMVGVMVGPHDKVHGKNESPARIMFGFVTEDVKGEFDRIKAIGAEVIAEPYNANPDDKEAWLATLADPDGNYFQLMTPWKM